MKIAMIAAGVLGGLIVAGGAASAAVWGMSTSSRVEDLESLAERQGVELAATRTDLSTTQESLASTQGDLSSTRDELSSTKAELASTQGDLSSTRDELSSTKADLASTQGDLSSTRDELSSTKAELASTQGDLSSTRDELSSTQQNLASTQRSLSATQGDLSSTQDSLASTRQDLSSTQRSLSATQGDLSATQDSLASTRQDLSSTQRSLSATQGDLSATQGDLSSTQDSLASTQEDLSSTQRDLSSTKARVASEQRLLASTRRALDETNRGISDVRADLDEVMDTYGNIEALGRRVSSLNEDISSLEEEIDTLKEDRKPLILETYRTHYRCSGSMEPKLTCLDEGTYLENFRPEDIVVGATISFTAVEDCKISGRGQVTHRVIAIKEADGTYFFRTKGDNNRGDDGCWIPDENVDGYLVEIHKDVFADTLNAELREIYNTLYQEYKSICRRWSASSSSCLLPEPHFSRAVKLYDQIECWLDIMNEWTYPVGSEAWNDLLLSRGKAMCTTIPSRP